MAKNRYNAYTHPPYELEKQLLLAIKQMKLNEGIEILVGINKLERAQLATHPLNSLKYSLVASCTLFTRAIIEAGVDSETAFMLSDYYINLIDQSKTTEVAAELEYQMIKDFIMLLKTQKAYSYHPLVNKTLAYINKHLESKLTLGEVATHMGVHPNYLATLFKKETGKTLLQYIDQQKIEAISNYLIYTEATSSEIEEIFHFKSASYLVKYFKKHTGLTPVEYRKLHKGAN